jgi:hypothetical protein
MKIFTQNRNKLIQSVTPAIAEATGITVATDYTGVYVTRFTVPSTVQAVAAADLAWGKALGTLPKVNFAVLYTSLDLTYVSSVANTVQMDIGVGTLIGSGAEALLSAVGDAEEDCFDGQTATAFNGTTPVNYSIADFGQKDIKDGTSTAKTLYLNMAGGFGAVTGNLTYSGEVTIVWAVLHTA